jgi:hypothetical protein
MIIKVDNEAKARKAFAKLFECKDTTWIAMPSTQEQADNLGLEALPQQAPPRRVFKVERKEVKHA